MPAPARRHVNSRPKPRLPKPGRRGAAAIPGQRTVQRARVPLKFSLCPGRGLCPSLLGDALPGARAAGRAGGERD